MTFQGFKFITEVVFKELGAGIQFYLCCLGQFTNSLLENQCIHLLVNGLKREITRQCYLSPFDCLSPAKLNHVFKGWVRHQEPLFAMEEGKPMS